MFRKPLLNSGIQVFMAGVKYALQVYTFAQIPLETVGEITLVLTFVTSASFVAGYELHQHLNRPIVLGQTKEVRAFVPRIIIAFLTMVLLAFVFINITEMQNGHVMIALLLVVGVLEYLNLELGRLLIINGRYLIVTLFGGFRSLAPFLAGAFEIITVTEVLFCWAIMSAMTLPFQTLLLHRGKYVTFGSRRLRSEDIKTGLQFFLSSGVVAVIPFGERWLVFKVFGLDALGLFALVIIFVGMGDMLIKGSIWQPFIRTIVLRFRNPSLWVQTLSLLAAASITIYSALLTMLLIFNDFTFTLLNKPIPSTSLVVAVFFYGTCKILNFFLFQLFYANHCERLLPWVQIGIALSVGVVFFMAYLYQLNLATVFSISALVWLVAPMLALVLYSPVKLMQGDK